MAKFHPSHKLQQSDIVPYEFYCTRCVACELTNGWLEHDCDYIMDKQGPAPDWRRGPQPQIHEENWL